MANFENFIVLRSRLVLVLLIYRRLESGSGATLAQLLFRFSYANYFTCRAELKVTLKNSYLSQLSTSLPRRRF